LASAAVGVLVAASAANAAATTTYASDLAYTVAANGWGPVEKDKSNGESTAGDGRSITLNGVTYAKGLGTHAASDVSVPLNSCTRFRSDVGVDDEVGSNGSVVFQVYVDGVKKYESPILKGSSATATADVDVTGGKTLRLVVTNGGDGTSYDHADWAGARVTCATSLASTGSTSTTSASSGTTSSGAAPVPPSTYSLPSGAVRVTNISELKTALKGSNKNIVLANGIYDAGTYLNADGAHNLYAEHLGKAVLRSGLVVGSNYTAGGGIIRGLTFDVSSSSETYNGIILQNWGPGGVNMRVLDCVFRGNRVIKYGLLSVNPKGLDVERAIFTNFTDGALRASYGSAVAYGGSTPALSRITDIQIDGVARSTPGSSNGTAESGIFLGHPVANGVHRIKIRNTSWAGMLVANNAWNTTFTDLDIDMSGPNVSAGVGIYLEHFNYYNTFTNFLIKGAKMGFSAEWADPSWGGVAASHYSTITNGTIDASGASFSKTWGVYLDEGTGSTTVTYVTFRNQSFAAIGAYKNVGTNVFQNNDTNGILSTAKPISYVHYSANAP